MKRIPRKIKKKIPIGLYCYNFLKLINTKRTEDVKIKIKLCLFYEHIEGIEGNYRLLKCDVLDQVKECSHNHGRDK